MERETTGTVLSASRQWWCKVNTSPTRILGTDGAIYPYVIKITYQAAGQTYTKRQWLAAGRPVPAVGSTVRVRYDATHPRRAKVL